MKKNFLRIHCRTITEAGRSETVAPCPDSQMGLHAAGGEAGRSRRADREGPFGSEAGGPIGRPVRGRTERTAAACAPDPGPPFFRCTLEHR